MIMEIINIVKNPICILDSRKGYYMRKRFKLCMSRTQGVCNMTLCYSSEDSSTHE